MVQTHYDNLQVTRTASPEVIRGAYRFLSQKWHPDKNPDNRAEAERILKVINRAYEVLSDPIRRKEHDDWIVEQEAAHASKVRESHSANETPSQTRPPNHDSTHLGDKSSKEARNQSSNPVWDYLNQTVPYSELGRGCLVVCLIALALVLSVVISRITFGLPIVFMFWACVVLYVVLIAFRRIKHESAGDQRQEMQFQLAVLLTLIFMAPVWWQLLQFDAGNGHVWKAPKVLWFISYACCWLTLTVGIRGVFSEKALLSGGFLRGWLVALLALSLTIAGLFGLFFFGLDSQTLASIGGSVGAKFSGDSLYAISMASALFWSPLIAISLLLPARFIVFAFRSFGRSMTAKPQQDKAWTLLGAMMLIWLLSLLVVGVNEAIEAIESKASQSVPPGQATADTRIGPSGASTEAGIESQEAGAGRVDASSARVGGDGLRDAEVALYDKFPFLDRSSQRPYEEAILAVNKRAKELVFSGMGASEALLQAGRELGPRYASIRRAEETVYQEYPFLDNLSPLADPAAILTVNKRAKQLVSDGMAPDDALLKAGREVGSANNENRRR